ncbi:unnamed protein product [Trifolium pratense]|uniref:Uncharacterized protein n=1 Tax=Trifolium pratense TaxID=57577 RepID=A0ACB0LB55_TRIPR|nr:unnamed protein product [Trifolium pratense]
MNIIKTNKACAACKYQRRKCSKDCPLAPYFPADKPKMFGNAHRLYGVSNILKILKEIDDDKKDDAMKSIIFESDIRAKFRVDGCFGVIKHYEGLLKESIKELDHVEKLLNYCKLNYPLQQQNLHSTVTNYQTPNIPIFNNIGDVSNYYHNSENNNHDTMRRASSSYINIHHDVNNSGGDNVMEDNYDEELKLDGGVDAQISTNFDLKQKERLLDGDKLAISDYELNMFIYGRQPFVQKDAAEFSSVESNQSQNDQLKNLTHMENSTPSEVSK